MEIKFTDTARDIALEMLNKEVSETGERDEAPIGIRIKIAGGGCAGFHYSMFFETSSDAKENDKVFEFGALRVYIDPFSLQYLDGATVDYVKNETGEGFKFDNPSFKKTCNCGETYS